MQYIEKLRDLVANAESTVFFRGAGVSTASGIPDFRSSDGLYNSDNDEGESPEYKLHRRYLNAHPEKFFDFYRRCMIYPDACPNEAHKSLAALERLGFLSAVITQNIDGLHRDAGSDNVIELHGSVHRNYCVSCGKRYTFVKMIYSEGVPRCDACGGIVRPDVTLYGEALDSYYFDCAVEAINDADLLIVGGTSLRVSPAADLVAAFEGTLVIINRDPTPFDYCAELVIRDPIEAVLPELIDKLADIL